VLLRLAGTRKGLNFILDLEFWPYGIKTRIGQFYNGRDHSTVCYAIKRIQALRDANAEVEGLLSSLIQGLTTDKRPEVDPASAMAKAGVFRARDMIWTNEMLDDLAERIASRLRSGNGG
jgi:hypothetical protein